MTHRMYLFQFFEEILEDDFFLSEMVDKFPLFLVVCQDGVKSLESLIQSVFQDCNLLFGSNLHLLTHVYTGVYIQIKKSVIYAIPSQ